MLAGLLEMAQERPRRPILPEAALMRLQEHQQHYAAWLSGPAPWKAGDVVTVRRDAPIGGHGGILLVVDVDRVCTGLSESGEITEPPSRSRKTGLREDVRVAFVANDDDSSIRAMWIEGWMLEAWSLEQAQQFQKMAEADTSGRAQ